MGAEVLLSANKGQTKRTYDILKSLHAAGGFSVPNPDREQVEIQKGMLKQQGWDAPADIPLADCWLQRRGNRIEIAYSHGAFHGELALVIALELIKRYPEFIKKAGWDSVGYCKTMEEFTRSKVNRYAYAHERRGISAAIASNSAIDAIQRLYDMEEKAIRIIRAHVSKVFDSIMNKGA